MGKAISSIASAIALGFVALAFAPSASTQPSPHPVVQRFAGIYRNVLADGGRDVIRAAIDAGVEPMAPVRRNVAHRRLLSGDPPIPRITIAPEGAGLLIDYTLSRHNRTPGLGVFAENAAAGGGMVDIKHDVVGDRLRETYRESRGGAVHIFELSPDGRRLTLQATITSRFLPGPIRYSLEFERVR